MLKELADSGQTLAMQLKLMAVKIHQTYPKVQNYIERFWLSCQELTGQAAKALQDKKLC